MANKPFVLIATHSVVVNGKGVHGPAHILADFLEKNHVSYKLIELPLASGLLDWPKQMKQVAKAAEDLRPTVFIGIDPLNGWVGRSLKRRGLVETFVYHTPDYSPKRFSFPPLNELYHWIDRQALKAADYVWTVSSRITDIRHQQGRMDARTIFNGIPFEENRIPALNVAQRFRLILVGNINESMDIPLIIDTVGGLKKKFPKLHIDIVGDGTMRSRLETKVQTEQLQKSVTFHGNVPLERVLELLKGAGIGLALYSGKAGFNAFGDSKKIREYSAVGLPVITTPIVVNAEEIRKYKAGIVTPPTANGLARAITKLAGNPTEYKKQRQAAIRLAKATDLGVVLTQAFDSIGIPTHGK